MLQLYFANVNKGCSANMQLRYVESLRCGLS